MALNFEDLGEFLKDNSKKAVEKAKTAANVAKITTDIKSEELKLRTTYAEIGKLFCDKAEGEVDEAFVPLLQRATDCKTKIAELESQQQKVKGMRTCPECGANSPENSKYCNNCGAEFVLEEADVVADDSKEENNNQSNSQSEEKESK